MPHRPFTPRQQRENRAFLAALRRTGNVRLTCRALCVHRACYTKRRARCPAFAAAWDTALAEAHAAFAAAGGERLTEGGQGTKPGVIASRGAARQPSLDVQVPLAPQAAAMPGGHGDRHIGARAPRDHQLRTKGGEPTIILQANGRLQLRHAMPGRMTRAAAREILATVEKTNNVRMAAAGAGFAASSVIIRARHSPDFARSLATARQIGRDRVLWQIMHPPGENRDFAILPMPPTTAEQALLQHAFHNPDGPFQRYRHTRRRPLPRPLSYYQPQIIARLNAWQRAEWYEETGTWRYDEEESEAAGEQ